MELNSLMYEVKKDPTYDWKGDKIPRYYAITRYDTKEVLGIVKRRYKVLQNEEAIGFLQDLLDVSGGEFDDCGTFNDNRIVWLRAKMPEHLVLNEHDKIDKYLYLLNSFDGSHGLKVLLYGHRLACSNQLHIFNKENAIADIKHTRKMKNRMDIAKDIFEQTVVNMREFDNWCKTLSQVQIEAPKRIEYFEKVFKLDIKAEGRKGTRSTKILQELVRLSLHGKGTELPGVRNTLWGAYNACTEYVDHYRTTKKKQSADARFELNTIGSGAAIKDRAFELAKSLT